MKWEKATTKKDTLFIHLFTGSMFFFISDYGFNVWTHEEIRGARSQLHWPCGGEDIAYCLLGCNLVLVVQYLSNILSILEFPMPMQSDPPHNASLYI